MQSQTVTARRGLSHARRLASTVIPLGRHVRIDRGSGDTADTRRAIAHELKAAVVVVDH
jgi:hypothetical protein